MKRMMRTVAVAAGWLLMASGGLAVLAWLLGRLVSDRWLSTQWLSWIPTPVLAGPLLLAFLGALGPGRVPRLRRRRLHVCVAATCLLSVYFAFGEHRPLRSAPDTAGTLSVAYWNMSREGRRHGWAARVRGIIEILADVTIVIDASGIQHAPALVNALPPDITVLDVGRLTVLTRQPVLEARPIVRTDEVDIVLLRLDGRPAVDDDIILYAIDLPSDPTLSRMALADRVRGHLEDAAAPPPDIVIGDFNIPRGSASLRRLFPSLRHAYADGGHGYAASFHRRFPLYHIDHTLIGDALDCVRYDLIDTGIGRHRAQRAFVREAKER